MRVDEHFFWREEGLQLLQMVVHDSRCKGAHNFKLPELSV